MRAAGDRQARPPLHPEVDLVDEGGRLERVAGAFAPQMVGSQRSQLLVQLRQQTFGCGGS